MDRSIDRERKVEEGWGVTYAVLRERERRKRVRQEKKKERGGEKREDKEKENK